MKLSGKFCWLPENLAAFSRGPAHLCRIGVRRLRRELDGIFWVMAAGALPERLRRQQVSRSRWLRKLRDVSITSGSPGDPSADWCKFPCTERTAWVQFEATTAAAANIETRWRLRQLFFGCVVQSMRETTKEEIQQRTSIWIGTGKSQSILNAIKLFLLYPLTLSFTKIWARPY